MGAQERTRFKGEKMASSAGSPSGDPYRVRSISLPSRSHPLTVRVEQGLHSLKTWATSISTTTSRPQAAPAPTAELLAVGLLDLEEMYDCVEELLSLPQTQRALARHRRGNGAAEEYYYLESSVRLLDICGTTRDAVSSLRELARGLQSGLRTRRGLGNGDFVVRGGIRAFFESRRQAHKDGSRCLKTLKHVEAAGNLIATAAAADDDLSLALRALKDLKEITVVVFRSISYLFVAKQKRSWFPITPRLFQEEHGTSCCELEQVDSLLRSIHGRLSGKDIAGFEKKAEEARRRLQRLEVGMGGLEAGLEAMFRRLIQNRVTLLNILSPY